SLADRTVWRLSAGGLPTLDSATRRYAKCAPEASSYSRTHSPKRRKGSGLFGGPEPFHLSSFYCAAKLAAHALDVRAEVEFELVLRELDVALHIHQAHGRRVAILLDHFGLHGHPRAVHPNLRVAVAGSALRHELDVRSLHAAPERLFTAIFHRLRRGV